MSRASIVALCVVAVFLPSAAAAKPPVHARFRVTASVELSTHSSQTRIETMRRGERCVYEGSVMASKSMEVSSKRATVLSVAVSSNGIRFAPQSVGSLAGTLSSAGGSGSMLTVSGDQNVCGGGFSVLGMALRIPIADAAVTLVQPMPGRLEIAELSLPPIAQGSWAEFPWAPPVFGDVAPGIELASTAVNAAKFVNPKLKTIRLRAEYRRPVVNEFGEAVATVSWRLTLRRLAR